MKIISDSPYFSIQKSRNGKGVFANKPFRKNAVLFPILGKVIHHSEISRKRGVFQNNAFCFSELYYLSPTGHLGDYLNHSCQPNAKIIKKIENSTAYQSCLLKIKKK